LKNQTLLPPRFWDLWVFPVCPNNAEKQLISLITMFIIGRVFKKFSPFFRFKVNSQAFIPKKPFIPALSPFSALGATPFPVIPANPGSRPGQPPESSHSGELSILWTPEWRVFLRSLKFRCKKFLGPLKNKKPDYRLGKFTAMAIRLRWVMRSLWFCGNRAIPFPGSMAFRPPITRSLALAQNSRFFLYEANPMPMGMEGKHYRLK